MSAKEAKARPTQGTASGQVTLSAQGNFSWYYNFSQGDVLDKAPAQPLNDYFIL